MNKKVQSVAFANLVGSLIFIAIGVWAYFQMQSLQEVKNTYAQPTAFPMIMITGLLIFSAILLVQSILKLVKASEDDPMMEAAESINFIKDKGVLAAVIVIALCILFVALFRPLGYVLTGAIVSAIIMILIGKRNPVQVVLVSILVPLVMWLIFFKVLTVNIPMGPLSFLKDLVNLI